MYRIEKVTLFLGVGLVFTALFAAVFGPVIGRQKDVQRNTEKGSQFIRTVFLKVQSNQGKAVLLAPSNRSRSYRISLDGKSEYDWNQPTSLASLERPVLVPVKIGSRFAFQFRHSSYHYKVTNIDTNGVEVEIGSKGWFSSSQKVLLPRNRATKRFIVLPAIRF